MKTLTWTLCGLLVMAVLSAVTAAAPLPLNLDRFEMDDVELLENQVNRLDVQRNGEYEVEIKFTPTQDIRNLQLEVFASGFEFSDIAPIGETSRTFDADTNITYVRRFRLRLTDQVEEDDYKLRVLFTDRNNNELVKNFNVKFDVPRHGLKVEDIVFYPAGAVQAGQALLTTVRMENQGEKVEQDVRVEVSIPALGISGVDYIDEIRAGGNREKGTEEIFMRIPECAKPGSYDVTVKAWYNQLHDSVSSKTKVEVVENPACAERAKPRGPETLVVIKQALPPAGNQKEGVDSTARPGLSQEVKDASTGSTSDPDAATKPAISKVRTTLESILIILVALLVVVAVIIAFRGLNRVEQE